MVELYRASRKYLSFKYAKATMVMIKNDCITIVPMMDLYFGRMGVIVQVLLVCIFHYRRRREEEETRMRT